MPRVARKTAILTCRLPPEVKQQLALAADIERRSQASMLEVMVLDWCRRHGVATKSPGKTHKA